MPDKELAHPRLVDLRPRRHSPRSAFAQGTADSWPNKPVRIVVPFAPGGTTDILARAMAPKLAARPRPAVRRRQQPGAGGNIGADMVAKSPPDGHTLLIGTVGTHGDQPGLYQKLPFDPAGLRADHARARPDRAGRASVKAAAKRPGAAS